MTDGTVLPLASVGEAGLSAPIFVIEQPYPLGQRPRPASPIAAAADDEALATWNVGGSADPNYLSNRASYHPGTRVTVETRMTVHLPRSVGTTVSRELTPERVQAQARSTGYWPYRLCFEGGQREQKGAGGETRILFSIGVHGKVVRAHLLGSQLGNAKTAECLRRETGKLRFSPLPRRALRVVASVELWPGDAELPPAAVSTLLPLGPARAFDPDAVRLLVDGKRAQIASCFEASRSVDPRLWGRLALAAVLEVDGSVHRISEVESRFPSAGAVRCVQTLIAGLVFPSVNGKPFTVVVPVRLQPAAEPQAVGVGQDPAHAMSPAAAVENAAGSGTE